jgi:hypothetical protein
MKNMDVFLLCRHESALVQEDVTRSKFLFSVHAEMEMVMNRI